MMKRYHQTLLLSLALVLLLVGLTGCSEKAIVPPANSVQGTTPGNISTYMGEVGERGKAYMFRKPNNGGTCIYVEQVTINRASLSC